MIILGDMGVNLAPALAGAGVLGIAIGFGAQNLVQDFLAGILMLLEDKYGVGDVIAPLRQWEVARERRERLKTALDGAGGDGQVAGHGGPADDDGPAVTAACWIR